MTIAFASSFFSVTARQPATFPVNRGHAPPLLHALIPDLGEQHWHRIDIFQPLPEHQSSMLPSGLRTLPTLVTSVKVFDASTLTDTVVVSNSFWNTLSAKLPALLLAQFLASVAFVAIVSILAAQGRFLLEVTSSNNTAKKGLAKANESRWMIDEIPLSIDFSKLLVCIIVDIIGSANEAIPLVGEIVDVVYAPIAALLLRRLFKGSNIIFLLEFVEEILPFTDVLPLATICWVVETFFSGGTLARALRIGDFSPSLEPQLNEISKEMAAEDAAKLQIDLEDDRRRD
ncbi:hypothetical protein ACHAW6_007824 [Cyclotella cf. meneghiniana]